MKNRMLVLFAAVMMVLSFVGCNTEDDYEKKWGGVVTL